MRQLNHHPHVQDVDCENGLENLWEVLTPRPKVEAWRWNAVPHALRCGDELRRLLRRGSSGSELALP